MPLNIKCKDCRDFANAPTLPHKGVCKRMVLRSDPDEVRGCGCFHPASKADRLRAMTDEELAKFFFRDPAHLYMKTPKETLDWLKSPADQAKESGHEE